MKFQILIRKIRRNIEDYSLLGALRKGLSYAVRGFFAIRVYRTYCIDLNKFKIPQTGSHKFFWKKINRNDFATIKQIEKMAEWLDNKLAAKLDKGDVCIVALDKTKVAGFNLIEFGEVHLPVGNFKKILKKDEAWSEQIMTHKDYRRQGLAAYIRFIVFQELKKMKVNKFCGGSFRDNQSNLELARKTGFQEINDIYYFKLLFFKKWKIREMVK